MIYDCFTFFNELELLELRLNELGQVVDKFVLVEATITFDGRSKPLYFQENRNRYAKFADKIIHIVAEPPSDIDKRPTWFFEEYQKNMMVKGLSNGQPDDVVIFSDIDEIPRAEKILQYKDTPGIKVFSSSFYYYFLNKVAYEDGKPLQCLYPIMVHYKDLKPPQTLRLLSGRLAGWYNKSARLLERLYCGSRVLLTLLSWRRSLTVIKDGGWHFSYLGGINRIIEKIELFARTKYHWMYNTEEFKNPERIKALMEQGRDIYGRPIEYKTVPVDETFPAYLRQNLNRFKHLIAND